MDGEGHTVNIDLMVLFSHLIRTHNLRLMVLLRQHGRHQTLMSIKHKEEE